MSEREKLKMTPGEVMSLVHDLNNITMIFVASLATYREAGDEEKLRLAEMAMETMKRLQALLDRVAGSTHPGDAVKVARRVVKGLRLLAAAGITFHLSTNANALSVSMTDVRLDRMVSNLCRNALDCLVSDGGCVKVSVNAAENGLVEIRVADNGPGIPESLRERIFEDGFTTKPTGNGLGLATVKRLVEEAGGNVRLETGNQGTTFVVQLPTA